VRWGGVGPSYRILIMLADLDGSARELKTQSSAFVAKVREQRSQSDGFVIHRCHPWQLLPARHVRPALGRKECSHFAILPKRSADKKGHAT